MSHGSTSSGSLFKDGAIDLIAGTLGGVANVYAGQPLDTVKVKVQTFPHLYNNWVTCLKDTYRLDGVRGLYAGTLPALAANVAENAVLFTAYGYCQKLVGVAAGRSDVSNMTPLENAFSGSLAAVFAAAVLCPTELVKCRLQAAREMKQKCTPASVCRDMYREKGLRGFFVGMTPTLAREVPGYFCFFGAYETCRYLLASEDQSKEEIGLFKTALSGSVGGMALWTSIFPADVVKSRMQVSGGGSFGRIIVEIVRNEGLRGLYKGLLPTNIRTCFASGCLFVAYEESRKYSFFLISRVFSSSVKPEFFKVEVVTNNHRVGRKKVVQERFTKQFRHRVSDYLKAMSCPEIEEKLAPLRAAVKECGDLVRDLKGKGAAKIDIDKAVVELKARKKKLEETEIALAPKEASFDRLKLEDLLKRRFFYDQSFAIYGGVTGLYDFGPMGCALKSNMLQEWRKHFILEEGMLEVDCTSLTPEPVLKASGHVDRFADWMVKDTKNGECFRADHLIKNSVEKLLQDKKTSSETRDQLQDVLARLEGFDDKDMHEVISRFNFKSPITGNDLTAPIAFNLMFPTQIGPTGDFKAFLRPETAQGIFVNFKRLLEFNQGKLPFAAAQIGTGFRNEISPRQGLIRVREFTMCEIEHFVDPEDKKLAKFSKVANERLTLFSACNQMDGQPAQQMAIGEAVQKKVVANETLGYYMARCQQYLHKVGIDPRRMRFRQHLSNEMAHYAQDCWDAEILTSYGWIECVGNADRACYDLQQHYKATNVKLTAEKKLPAPRNVSVVEPQPNMALLGKSFKKDAKKIQAALSSLPEEEVVAMKKELQENKKYELKVDSESFTLTPETVAVKRFEKTVHVEEITPSVIEPSYGIGRIMYSLLEHSFRQREGDEQRTFLSLKPLVAPIKCSVLPISANEKLSVIIEAVKEELAKHDMSFKVDDSSGSIGRRYARTDEIGIPFGVTVDFESEAKPWTVTLRHAESMAQVRLELSELGRVVSDLVSNRLTWSDVQDKYPKFETKAE
ncbi:unnamed protein product [Caenorhabditis auriculariae]|uniref:Glycine--tRNA ligase n=1 Tax=Caenorhabditis auriculariae TaxID=2777116 RepID=A0A8S1GX03_9PELO|nr:unnamed protein product [Caenorhabditis auriculariae]